MTEQGHTPEPLFRLVKEHEDLYRIKAKGKPEILITLSTINHNEIFCLQNIAAGIVRACNSHEALVKALEAITEEAEDAQEDWMSVQGTYAPVWTWPFKTIAAKAQAALALAKGEREQ